MGAAGSWASRLLPTGTGRATDAATLAAQIRTSRRVCFAHMTRHLVCDRGATAALRSAPRSPSGPDEGANVNAVHQELGVKQARGRTLPPHIATVLGILHAAAMAMSKFGKLAVAAASIIFVAALLFLTPPGRRMLEALGVYTECAADVSLPRKSCTAKQ